MSTLQQELKVIPTTAWAIAGVVFCAVAAVLYFLMGMDRNPPAMAIQVLASIGPLLVASLVLASLALVIGYINGDARRRGMRHVMWTLLAIFIPNAIGIILYFILRDPLPVCCTACGVSMRPAFAFCPRCGASVQPACPQCRRPVEAMWTNCAYCGTRLGPGPAGRPGSAT
jgi:hypothetical protein